MLPSTKTKSEITIDVTVFLLSITLTTKEISKTKLIEKIKQCESMLIPLNARNVDKETGSF